jgi:hypothetical protein
MEDCHQLNTCPKKHLRLVTASPPPALLDLHLLYVLRNDKATTRPGADFIDGHVWRKFYKVKLAIVPVHIEDREICDDLADSTSTCEGKRAFFQDLWAAVLCAVLHGYDDPRLVWVRYEVHSTTNALHVLSIRVHGDWRSSRHDSPFTSLPGTMKFAISPHPDTCIACWKVRIHASQESLGAYAKNSNINVAAANHAEGVSRICQVCRSSHRVQ